MCSQAGEPRVRTESTPGPGIHSRHVGFRQSRPCRVLGHIQKDPVICLLCLSVNVLRGRVSWPWKEVSCGRGGGGCCLHSVCEGH